MGNKHNCAVLSEAHVILQHDRPLIALAHNILPHFQMAQKTTDFSCFHGPLVERVQIARHKLQRFQLFWGERLPIDGIHPLELETNQAEYFLHFLESFRPPGKIDQVNFVKAKL